MDTCIYSDHEIGLKVGMVIGALFIPSLALALGIWSGSRKLFEVVYMLWWYAGPINQVDTLDFMGASSNF